MGEDRISYVFINNYSTCKTQYKKSQQILHFYPFEITLNLDSILYRYGEINEYIYIDKCPKDDVKRQSGGLSENMFGVIAK